MPVFFKPADDFTATMITCDQVTLLDLLKMFGAKSDFVVEIRHPLDPSTVFKYSMTEASKEDFRQGRVV